VLRQLLNLLANQHQLVEKLSESYPVRRAAQVSVYTFLKGKRLAEEALQELPRRAASFDRTLREEVKRGWSEAQSGRKKP